MLRHLHAIWIFWTAAIAAELEYRINFVLAAVASLLTLGAALLTLRMFYSTGYEMGGWAWPQALIVVGVYTLMDGFQSTFLMPNRMHFSMHVREGTLDFILLKPMDAQFWMSVRRISIFGAPNLIIGLALIVYGGSGAEQTLHVGHYLVGLIPIALGMVILYSIGYALMTLCIWFTKLDNLNHALQALLETGRYPIPAYAYVYRILFTFVIPVAFMTTVPAQVMLGKPDAWAWLGGAAVIALLSFAFARWFWQFALRFYTSASS